MGLADRYYMRQPSGGLTWSATTTLLVLNWLVFLLQFTSNDLFWNRYFALSLDGLRHGFVWQLITFQFLHAGWMHIIFNSIGLYFVGRGIEFMLGAKRYVQLYLICGVAGGLLQMAFAAVAPMKFDGPVVGASAGVSGLLATFAMMNWSNRFLMFLYFFPVPMTGRTLIWILLGLSVIGIAFPSGSVAHAAHLGGVLAGMAWVKLNWHLDYVRLPWESWGEALAKLNPFKRRRPNRDFVRANPVKNSGWKVSSPGVVIDVQGEEFISKEVDPILDKISAHGIQSLTERERQILEKARSKMAK